MCCSKANLQFFLNLYAYSVRKKTAFIDQREIEICGRVKFFREQIKWPQSAFAKELGVSRDQLANIEYARVALKMNLGATICRVFNVNGEWLASGVGVMHGGSPMLTSLIQDPSWYSMLFSEAYDQCPQFFRSPTYAPRYPVSKPTPGFDPQAFLLQNILLWFRVNNFKTTLDAENFAREVCDFAEKYLDQIRETGTLTRQSNAGGFVLHSRESAADESKPLLDKVARLEQNLAVKHKVISLSDLLARLEMATKPRGKKAELARELKLSRQAVNQWVKKTSQPSAEKAFELLNWVEQQERQK